MEGLDRISGELIRQVSIESTTRGRLLARLINEYRAEGERVQPLILNLKQQNRFLINWLCQMILV
jgi:hypothetical protein